LRLRPVKEITQKFMLDLAIAYRIDPHVSKKFPASGKGNSERRIRNEDGGVWMAITQKWDRFDFRVETISFVRPGGGPR
jgi:hypothetical protein